jgi:hypothetical protein
MENTRSADTYVDVMLRVNGSARRLRLEFRWVSQRRRKLTR